MLENLHVGLEILFEKDNDGILPLNLLFLCGLV